MKKEDWINEAEKELTKWVGAETESAAKSVREWAETLYKTNVEDLPDDEITPTEAVDEEKASV